MNKREAKRAVCDWAAQALDAVSTAEGPTEIGGISDEDAERLRLAVVDLVIELEDRGRGEWSRQIQKHEAHGRADEHKEV